MNRPRGRASLGTQTPSLDFCPQSDFAKANSWGKCADTGCPRVGDATLKALTEETIKSSAIEGVALNPESVRSSIARRLGLEAGGIRGKEDRNVEGVVEMMLDATQNYEAPLHDARLFGWHNSLFPTGYSGLHKFVLPGGAMPRCMLLPDTR